MACRQLLRWGPGPTLAAATLLGLPFALTCGYLFYRRYERPFLNRPQKA